MKVSDYISSIIIMLCHLCVVVPCFYYSCSLDWKPKDDRPFMVFLPPGACTMPEFQRILLTYREKVRRFTYVELAITPLFWFLNIAGQLILTTAAIIAYLMVPNFFGRRTRAELIALKKEKKWITEYTAVHRADMRLGGKKISRQPYIILFFISALFPAGYIIYTVFYKTGAASFSELLSILLCEITLLTAAFWQRRRYRTWKNEILHPGEFYSGNEDDYWLLVWVITAVPLVYFTAYPYYVDYTGHLVDIQLSADGSELEIDGAFYQATIPLQGLTSVRLINNLDELGPGVRRNGTGTSVYGKGHFRYENTGPVISYTAYKHPPYILLTVENGQETTTYLVNDDDAKGPGRRTLCTPFALFKRSSACIRAGMG